MRNENGIEIFVDIDENLSHLKFNYANLLNTMEQTWITKLQRTFEDVLDLKTSIAPSHFIEVPVPSGHVLSVSILSCV